MFKELRNPLPRHLKPEKVVKKRTECIASLGLDDLASLCEPFFEVPPALRMNPFACIREGKFFYFVEIST